MSMWTREREREIETERERQTDRETERCIAMLASPVHHWKSYRAWSSLN